MNLNKKAVSFYTFLGFKRLYTYGYRVKNILIMLNDILENYKSIICLMIEGENNYESMRQYIINFNSSLLNEIETIIDDGKITNEISNTVDSKSSAKYILESLQSNVVLWAMNQGVDIKNLYEVNFKHIWNKIKSSVPKFEILNNSLCNTPYKNLEL